MIDRQHSAPILIKGGGTSSLLKRLPMSGGDATTLEAEVQELVHPHPSSLPIAEIDPLFVGALSICREMQLGKAGRIDNFLLTPSGLPVLVECKLWRNPEARREVIGQILDYAKTLSRWSFSDLQREVSARTGGGPDTLLQAVRSVDPTIEESAFVDAVTVNLKRGRFLLLILGDGIREDVEAIAAYLQGHAGLNFTFGLVEFPIYDLHDGDKLVAPRVVARTTSIVRHVVVSPDGHDVQDAAEAASTDAEGDDLRAALGAERQAFWTLFIDNYLDLDDRSQPPPRPSRLGYISAMLPAPEGSSWLTIYRDMHAGSVGVFLSASRNSPGEGAMLSIIEDWTNVSQQLGGTARLETDPYKRPRIVDSKRFGDLRNPEVTELAFAWLAERVNVFVNVLRPLVRDSVADEQT